MVIVGLGNPRDEYHGTRHNIGFACVDAIAKAYGWSFANSPKHHALIAEGTVNCIVQTKIKDNEGKKDAKKEKMEEKDKVNTNNNTDNTDNANNINKKENEQPKIQIITSKVTKQVLLVKPTTFMNRSGTTVASIIRSFRLDAMKSLLVIVDDTDLEVGRVLLKKGGGSSQNGIEDIVNKLHTPHFLRARFGIAQGGSGKSEHVLGKFTRRELSDVHEGISRVRECAKVWVEKGEVHAMNSINKR